MPEAVLRAKMKAGAVTQSIGTDGKPMSEQVSLMAVSGAEGTANAQWSKYTPAGQISLTITNPEAFGKLCPSLEFFVDFTPAE